VPIARQGANYKRGRLICH